MTRRLLPLIPLTLIGFAACGGPRSSSVTAPADADLAVRAKSGIVWDQKSYSASATDGKLVVTLINDGSQPHNLHIVDSDGNDVDKSTKAPSVQQSGDSKTATFTIAPGSYRIVCKIPGHTGMDAPLTVN
ncbi:MAG: plastocyanin/azurin family copper-binding protein [Ilumatobacteraceae bacterium]